MINWQEIDTVLLDMDGTLLDLHFDDCFWQVCLPRAWGAKNGIDEASAKAQLKPTFIHTEASLDWYSLDFWSEHLQLDVYALAEEITHLVQLRPHVEEFLEYLLVSGKDVIMVTNSHEKFIDLKMGLTGVDRHFKHIFNAHDFGHPKEEQKFWEILGERVDYDKKSTLLIDDNHNVLRSAKEFGIQELLSIAKPSSKAAVREEEDFRAVHSFQDLCS